MNPIDILRTCYPARREIIPCLLGEPGIGKTQCVYQLGKELGVEVHMMNMNGKTPNEIVGMAMPNSDEGTMDMFDYGILCKAKDGDIVIIDEMLTSAPSCLNAILTLAESRILPSGRKIADVMLVAAANPLPSPERISLAVRDRFQFINVEYDPKLWKQYILDKFGIKLNDSLVSRVRVRGNGYNVATPRTMTKYIWWLSKICSTKKERENVYEVIAEVFDKPMAEEFRRQFECKTKEEQMYDAFRDIGLVFNKNTVNYYRDAHEDDEDCVNEVVADKDISDMNIAEILETLMKLEYWSEIEKQLTNIIIEDYEIPW